MTSHSSHLLHTPALTSLKIAEAKDLDDFISDVNTIPPKYDLVTSLTLNDISLPFENADIFSAFPKVSNFDVTEAVHSACSYDGHIELYIPIKVSLA